jgi:ribonuclease P protein component
MVEEAPREAHFPAQQPPPRQEARLPLADVHPGGSQRPAFTEAQGSPSSVGLIWRLRDRRSFLELRRRGRRARNGAVVLTMLAPDPTEIDLPPRLAFAVPRAVGPAVVRNRLRRRIRAHLQQVRAVTPERFGAGAWLVSLDRGAAELEPAALLASVDACLDRLAA